MARTDNPVETVEAVPSEPVSPAATEKVHRSMMKLMTEKYSKEKRVAVKIRNDGDVFVQVNGYTFLIKPNVKVEVPESLIPHLEEAGYI